MNILVVASHPDDEVLGCGGTIAHLAGKGHDVHVLILGEGITSRHVDRAAVAPKELQVLHEQAEKAGAVLGVKSVLVHNFPDNRFDTVPLLDIVKAVEDHIEKIQPEVVYTQHGGDLNIDHVCTFRAVLTALRPVARCTVKKVYAYEVPSSTEWSFRKFAPVFSPNVFVDISKTIEKKVDAMKLYEGEIRTFPHPRSPQALHAHAQYWGSVAGLEAAEAFELIREVRQ